MACARVDEELGVDAEVDMEATVERLCMSKRDPGVLLTHVKDGRRRDLREVLGQGDTAGCRRSADPQGPVQRGPRRGINDATLPLTINPPSLTDRDGRSVMAIESMLEQGKTGRRGFFGRVGGWAMAVGGFLGIPGCDTASVTPQDDFSMHGPIQASDWALTLPEAPSAAPLFAPYQDGRPFLRRWAIGRLCRGNRDQLVILVVDTETGGHAEMELYARDPAIDPVAASKRYAFMVDNGGRGDMKTPLHMCRLAERLAEIITEHEQSVTLSWRIPTLKEAIAAEDGRPSPRNMPELEPENVLSMLSDDPS